YAKEASDPAKMIGCFLARLADDRYVQAPADCFSDRSSRYALVGHTVVPCSDGTVLEHEPVEMSSIEPMHGGPAIEPVPDKYGNTLFPCDADQTRHKAVVTGAMDRRGKTQDRCANSSRRQRKRR